MPLDLHALLNWPFDDIVHRYSERDSMLYALGIGLGHDPVDRRALKFVYEQDLEALPTMPVVLGRDQSWQDDPRSGVDSRQALHGEQGISLHGPVPTSGAIRSRGRITSVVDKGEGKGAVVYSEREVVEHETGRRIATVWASTFLRGHGGFHGPTGPVRELHQLPKTPAECVVAVPTLPQAALIYRLSGDYNPLHADPPTAKAAGFPRPILHGLCTFGIAGYAVLQAHCGFEAKRLRSLEARFTSPVFPGETVSIEMWRARDTISFAGFVQERGIRVLDNGKAEVRD